MFLTWLKDVAWWQKGNSHTGTVCSAASTVLLWLPHFCIAATPPPVQGIVLRLRADRAVCRCRVGSLPAAVRQ